MNNNTHSPSTTVDNEYSAIIPIIVVSAIVGSFLLCFVSYRFKECHQKWKKKKEDEQFDEALIKKEEQDKINNIKKKYRDRLNFIKSKNTVILEPDGHCIEDSKNNDEKV